MRLEYRPVDRRNPRSLKFEAYRRDPSDFAGESALVEQVFALVGPTNKTCIELGAADGKWLSNTRALISEKGWRGILIEGSEKSFRELQLTYSECPHVKLVNRYADLCANSLDTILEEAGCPAEPDFLSLDIDGIDWWVWKSLSQHRPRVAMIEFNPTIPNDVLFVPDPDQRQGCSLSALVELSKEKGYELAATTTRDALFVRADLFSLLDIADNSIDALHYPGLNETKVFQLYDGSVRLVGNDKMHWGEGTVAVYRLRNWRHRLRSVQRCLRRALRFQLFT